LLRRKVVGEKWLRVLSSINDIKGKKREKGVHIRKKGETRKKRRLLMNFSPRVRERKGKKGRSTFSPVLREGKKAGGI